MAKIKTGKRIFFSKCGCQGNPHFLPWEQSLGARSSGVPGGAGTMSEPEAWHEEGKAQLKKDKKHSRGGSSSVESAGSSGSGRDRSTGQSSESGGSNSPTTICRINDGYMLYLIAMHDHVRKKHLDTLGLRGDQESLSQDMNSMSAMNDLVLKELQRSGAAMQESKKEEWRSQATTFEEQDSGDKPASFRSCIFSVKISPHVSANSHLAHTQHQVARVQNPRPVEVPAHDSAPA